MQTDSGGVNAELFGTSQLHPVGVTLLMLFGFAMLLLPRRHVMVTFFAFLSFVAVGQRLVIFSLDFNFMRIMVLFGWVRMIMRLEFRGYRWNRMDVCFIAFVASQMVCTTIVVGGVGFVQRLGTSLDSFGAYFMARFLIKDLNDLRSFAYGLAFISVPVACFFLVEHNTQRNLFSVFGGVPEFTLVRDGKVRCQGAYAHPILAGCFWAVIFPLFVSQAFTKGRARIMAIIGVISSLVIIRYCASSTPVTGLLAAVIGFAMIPFRRSLGLVRLAIVVVVISLHLVMKRGVWFLIARTDFVGGSTGWHRANMIESFLNHAEEWFLFGTNQVSHWNVASNDLCNQYVLVGTLGGAMTLALFFLLIVFAFGNVGRAWRLVDRPSPDFLLTWAIGVSMLAHCTNFIGVAYFGQCDFLWYVGLALASAVPTARNPSRAFSTKIASKAHFSPVQVASVQPVGYR